jgi:hypothetical protein
MATFAEIELGMVALLTSDLELLDRAVERASDVVIYAPVTLVADVFLEVEVHAAASSLAIAIVSVHESSKETLARRVISVTYQLTSSTHRKREKEKEKELRKIRLPPHRLLPALIPSSLHPHLLFMMEVLYINSPLIASRSEGVGGGGGKWRLVRLHSIFRFFLAVPPSRFSQFIFIQRIIEPKHLGTL